MNNMNGGIQRHYANQSSVTPLPLIYLQSLIGLPGANDLNTKQMLRGMRDNLNVDDIEGAIPKRLIGVSY